MNRKEAIKVLATIGIIATMPTLVNVKKGRRRIHFVGLGGAGSKAMGKVYEQGSLAKYTYFTDVEHYKSIPNINFILYTPLNNYKSQISENSNPLIEFEEKIALPPDLKNIFNKNDSFILLAGLGGYTGTKTSEFLINWLIEKNIDFQAIFCLPFKFESKRRNIAQKFISKFQELPNLHFFDNEIIKEHFGNKPMAELLAFSDNEFCKIAMREDRKSVV